MFSALTHFTVPLRFTTGFGALVKFLDVKIYLKSLAFDFNFCIVKGAEILILFWSLSPNQRSYHYSNLDFVKLKAQSIYLDVEANTIIEVKKVELG